MYQVCNAKPAAQNAVISASLYSNVSGLTIRITVMVRERVVGVVLYCAVLYCILDQFFYYDVSLQLKPMSCFPTLKSIYFENNSEN